MKLGGPIAITGVTVGGLIAAAELGILEPPAKPKQPATPTGEPYAKLLAWGRSTYGYHASSVAGWIEEDRTQGLNVWGAISDDPKVPDWSQEVARKVLVRWIAIGKRFAWLCALHLEYGAVERIEPKVYAVEGVLGIPVNESPDLSWEYLSERTAKVTREIADAIERERSADSGPDLLDYGREAVEDVLEGAAELAGDVFGAGASAFLRALAYPLGALALLGIGYYIVKRRAAK